MYRSKTTATQMSSRHTGFGGFPNPVKAAFEMAADRFHRAVENKTTMSRTDTVNNNAFGRTVTFVGNNSGKQPDLKLTRTGTIASLAGVDVRPAPYINFDAVVGRNSHFHALTSAQAEELGGVEYKVTNTSFCAFQRHCLIRRISLGTQSPVKDCCRVLVLPAIRCGDDGRPLPLAVCIRLHFPGRRRNEPDVVHHFQRFLSI